MGKRIHLIVNRSRLDLKLRGKVIWLECRKPELLSCIMCLESPLPLPWFSSVAVTSTMTLSSLDGGSIYLAYASRLQSILEKRQQDLEVDTTWQYLLVVHY